MWTFSRRVTYGLLVIVRQEPVGTAVDLLYGIVACKIRQHLWIPVDADAVQGSGLALHDGPAAQVGLDVGVVRWHQANDGLAQQDVAFDPK